MYQFYEIKYTESGEADSDIDIRSKFLSISHIY